MKSTVVSSTVLISCAILAAAAPAPSKRSLTVDVDARDEILEARGGAAGKIAKSPAAKQAGKAVEKWALNPSGQTDKDTRKKNRESAVKLAGDALKKHGEKKKRDLSIDIDARDEILEARGGAAGKIAKSPAAKQAGKAVEKWALNPSGQTDKDTRKKNRESAVKLAGDALKKHGEKKKRDLSIDIDARDEILEARGGAAGKIAKSPAAKQAGKAVEKWALNPSGQTDKDTRKKNRESAVKLAGDALKKHGEKKKRDLSIDIDARDEILEARGGAAGKIAKSPAAKQAGKAVEKWALNPSGQTDKDTRKKNRESAVKLAGDALKKHGEKKKRALFINIDARDEILEARGGAAGKIAKSPAAKQAGKAVEKWALNPSGQTDKDTRKKNRESAVKLAGDALKKHGEKKKRALLIDIDARDESTLDALD
ncbi:hypothetical protein C8J56DRAFT_1052471 [Mycena floridula]|nr:hypothetical protein C8J56DRAFT_1052471 [Mycena floridula]